MFVVIGCSMASISYLLDSVITEQFKDLMEMSFHFGSIEYLEIQLAFEAPLYSLAFADLRHLQAFMSHLEQLRGLMVSVLELEVHNAFLQVQQMI